MKIKKELLERVRITEKHKESEKALSELQKLLDANKDCELMFAAVTGSVSYGLETETSDFDIKGIYTQPIENIYLNIEDNPTTDKEHLMPSDGKNDVTLYDIRKFIKMCGSSNPNIIELLNTPDDCIIYESPIWKEVKDHILKYGVVSKKCYYSFYSYSESQIKKAKSKKKKINVPISKERLTPLHFCHVIKNDKTFPLLEYLEKHQIDQREIGLAKLNNVYMTYSAFIGDYKGMVSTDKDGKVKSMELLCSSIPEGSRSAFLVSYHKDDFSTYCKKYREYFDWIDKRNDQRYRNSEMLYEFDTKNMSHCVRLVMMACEIAEGKGIQVYRSEEDRELIFKIRNGEMNYMEITDFITSLTDDMKEKYDNSSLQESPDIKGMKQILKKIYEART